MVRYALQSSTDYELGVSFVGTDVSVSVNGTGVLSYGLYTSIDCTNGVGLLTLKGSAFFADLDLTGLGD